ncbi:hypothetical protein BCF58_1005 [Chryseobacterium defluvii]|uniref:Uncharacterized protein n=1 Tax=Chryseobacterium defluvii TaxID=160396 RepID=A0A495SQW7_9FLAO|nr:hypothetical protein BCF58_1005 [Chryseobacterium defluvii]
MNQYHLIIPFWGDDISEDFGLRDVVVEYLEETLQSEVYEEGTGVDGMHVFSTPICQNQKLRKRSNQYYTNVLIRSSATL